MTDAAHQLTIAGTILRKPNLDLVVAQTLQPVFGVTDMLAGLEKPI